MLFKELNLSVTVPGIILKQIGIIEGSEYISETYIQIFRECFKSTLNEAERKNAEELGSYFFNTFLAPDLLQFMISQNVTFEASLNTLKPILIVKAQQILIPSLTESLKSEEMLTIISETIKKTVELSKANNYLNDSSCCSIQIPLTSEIRAIFENLRITKLAEVISQNPNISKIIFDTMIAPSLGIIDKQISNDDSFIIEAIKNELKKQATINLMQTIPLNEITSIILTNAINNNLTFFNSFLQYSKKELLEEVLCHILTLKTTENIEEILNTFYNSANDIINLETENNE